MAASSGENGFTSRALSTQLKRIRSGSMGRIERMDDFKKMLGVPVVPAAMDSFNPLAGLGNPTPSTAVPAIGLPSVPSASKAPSMNVQLGTIGGLPAPMASPLSAPSIPSYLNPAPPLEQPKPHQMPPATTFAAPRRAF